MNVFSTRRSKHFFILSSPNKLQAACQRLSQRCWNHHVTVWIDPLILPPLRASALDIYQVLTAKKKKGKAAF